MKIIDPFFEKKYHYRDEDFTDSVIVRIDELLEEKERKVTGKTLVFERCFFKKVSISTIQQLDFNYRISFKGCYVESFNGSLISTDNITIHCFSSHFKNFEINNEKVKFLYINNSFGNFRMNRCNNVKISYSKENIYPQVWKRLYRENIQILKTLTEFDIRNVRVLSYYTNEKPFTLDSVENIFDTDKFLFGESYNYKYNISKSDIEQLHISLILNYSSGFNHKKTTIKDARLKNIKISGKPIGQVILESLIVDNVYLHDLSPAEKLNLIDIKSNKEFNYFEIKNSILDNTWFYGIDFSNFKKISFFRSSFTNTKITSCIFPSVKKIEKNIQSSKSVFFPNKQDSVFYREQYELFLELKQAFDKVGNIYESQKMKSVALKALSKVEDLRFWDEKIILILNSASNKNGISPLRAFLWFVFFGLILHSLNVLSFNSIVFDIESNDTKHIIYKHFKYFFTIINPVHKTSSLAPEGELTTTTYLISYLSRIIIGYIYYQFVVSFRRFGKL